MSITFSDLSTFIACDKIATVLVEDFARTTHSVRRNIHVFLWGILVVAATLFITLKSRSIRRVSGSFSVKKYMSMTRIINDITFAYVLLCLQVMVANHWQSLVRLVDQPLEGVNI